MRSMKSRRTANSRSLNLRVPPSPPVLADCKQLAPTWQELATELADSNIRVAKVNGPECRTLVKRLDVKAYPSIFYLRDGEMREYTAARTLSALANFGRSGWRSVKPVPFWKAPNNWFGRACGVALAAPGVAAEMVEWSKKTYGVSDVVVLFVAFAVPTTVGMLAIALVDHLVVRQATMESANARRRDERERAARAREREEAAAGGDGGWEGGGGRDAAPHLHPHPHYE